LKETGIVLTAIGGAGLLWILFEIITDITGDLARYSYKLPLTHHELSNLVFLGVALALTIVGVVSRIRGVNKRSRIYK
jgi:hypothetical protein